jgi:hypothetical protein
MFCRSSTFARGDLMRAPILLNTILATAFPVVFAQTPTVDVTTATAPVNVLTIQDVDFINARTPKWLFTIDMRILGGGTGEPTVVTATMTIVLDVAMANGESFTNVSTYQTVPFEIRGSRSFTNLDLASPSIKNTYTTDGVAKRRLEDLALPTGYVPAGAYTFRVSVDVPQYKQTPRTTFRFVLTNPSRVELVFPNNNDTGVGEFPLFQWIFEGPRSRIAVYEMLPNQASLEEATSGIPHLSSDVNGTSFLYPSAGVRQLEPGKTYVWFVEGMYGVSGGVGSAIKSTLRSFTVASGGTNVALQSLLEELEKTLGPAHKSTFDQIRANLLSPTGQLSVDGKNISVSDLVELIKKFRANPAGVIASDLE